MIDIVSKLPQTGTTIFSHMSALAAEHDAVNLGQGFPDFDCDPRLIAAVMRAMQHGRNQYPPMSGVGELRQGVAEKIKRLYGHEYDADREITVTAGATQALFTAILCAVQPGDEVIMLEPAYDSYLPAVTLAGGMPKPVAMEIVRDAQGLAAGYAIPWEGLAAALTGRTRMLILNTPHNPTGTLWRQADMERLQAMLEATRVLLCADEVYEHIVFDGARHESVARYPALAARSFVISSFGKSLHVTGWKVGYVAAPAALMAEFRKVHQYNIFTVNSPMQHGIAEYMQDAATYDSLPQFYAHKRDLFRAGLAATGLKLLPCAGTYFQSAAYTGLAIPQAALPEREFAEWLTREMGVACIPLSAFYAQPTQAGVVRFCFAKREDTLKLALERLAKLGR